MGTDVFARPSLKSKTMMEERTLGLDANTIRCWNGFRKLESGNIIMQLWYVDFKFEPSLLSRLRLRHSWLQLLSRGRECHKLPFHVFPYLVCSCLFLSVPVCFYLFLSSLFCSFVFLSGCVYSCLNLYGLQFSVLNLVLNLICIFTHYLLLS